MDQIEAADKVRRFFNSMENEHKKAVLLRQTRHWIIRCVPCGRGQEAVVPRYLRTSSQNPCQVVSSLPTAKTPSLQIRRRLCLAHNGFGGHQFVVIRNHRKHDCHFSKFCAAGLLHKQMALLIFGMCVAAAIYLVRSKQMTRYVWTLCILSLLITIFTLTAREGYDRLHSAARPANSLGIRGIFLNDLTAYFSSIFNDCLFWVVLMGLCALFMIHAARDGEGRKGPFFNFYLTIGIVLFAMSPMLNLPSVQYVWKINSGLKLLAETAVMVFWISFLTVCLIAMIRTAKTCEKYRYTVVLFIGMWSSQAIPAVVGSWGCPLLPLVLLDFLLAVSLFQDLHFRYGNSARLSVASVGLCSMVIAAAITMRNYGVY